jgi:cytochrome c553
MRTTLLALIAIAGCDAAAEVPKQDLPLKDLPAKVRDIRDRMHVRFAATRRLERGIAFGSLDAVHAEAGLVARLDEPDLPAAWRTYVDQIRASARQIELAQDLVTAARTSALLGRRCAQCHEAADVKIAFAKEAPPPAGRKLPSHMAGHEWATARLWEGLIGPSSERWLEGARALTKAPLAIVAEGDNLPPELAVGDDVARIRLLATRAQATRTQDERAALYSDLLSTCTRCHGKIRDP